MGLTHAQAERLLAGARDPRKGRPLGQGVRLFRVADLNSVDHDIWHSHLGAIGDCPTHPDDFVLVWLDKQAHWMRRTPRFVILLWIHRDATWSIPTAYPPMEVLHHGRLLSRFLPVLYAAKGINLGHLARDLPGAEGLAHTAVLLAPQADGSYLLHPLIDHVHPSEVARMERLQLARKTCSTINAEGRLVDVVARGRRAPAELEHAGLRWSQAEALMARARDPQRGRPLTRRVRLFREHGGTGFVLAELRYPQQQPDTWLPFVRINKDDSWDVLHNMDRALDISRMTPVFLGWYLSRAISRSGYKQGGTTPLYGASFVVPGLPGEPWRIHAPERFAVREQALHVRLDGSAEFRPAKGWTINHIIPPARGQRAPFADEGFVGNFWGSAGAGILFYAYESDRYLLLKRSAEVQQPNTWGVPGGAVPIDKATNKRMDLWQAARKEAEEETGWAGGARPGAKYVWTDPKGSGFTYTTFVVPTILEFAPELNWESSDWAWLSLEDARTRELHFGAEWLLDRVEESRQRGQRALIRRV